MKKFIICLAILFAFTMNGQWSLNSNGSGAQTIGCSASGDASTAIGSYTYASGYRSTTMGDGTVSTDYASATIGRYNLVVGN